MTVALVVAGGPKEEIVLNDFLFSQDDMYIVGADHGAITLLEANIIPHAAIGDFDSLTLKEWQSLQRKVEEIDAFQAEKNETDTELAIVKALSKNPEKVYITGVTGGRLDHYESNLQTVYRLQKQYPSIPLYIFNKTNCLQFLFAGENDIVNDVYYKYLSFYAFGGSIEKMTLRGVKYETTNVDIDIGSSRFTSNEIVGQHATATFASGVCLMIRSKD